jgi:hypothetical protein
MRCAFCQRELRYIHGHAACVEGGCPMFGVNQAECCDGETAGCVPTSVVAGAPGVLASGDPEPDDPAAE